MSSKNEFDLSGMEINQEDIPTPSFKYIQWKNGDLRDKTNDLLKKGCWLVSPEDFPQLDGVIEPTEVTFYNGESKEYYLFETLNLAVLRFKSGYRDPEGNFYVNKKDIPNGLQCRFKVYLYSYCQELEEIAVITSSGMVAYQILGYLSGSKKGAKKEELAHITKYKLLKEAIQDKFNAPTTLPNYAVWLPLSSWGEKFTYNGNPSFSTPPRLAIPDKLDLNVLKTSFVGLDLYNHFKDDLMEGAKEWFDWKQEDNTSNGEEVKEDPFPIVEEEDVTEE